MAAAKGGAWRVSPMGGGLLGLNFNDAMTRLNASTPLCTEAGAYLLRCIEAGALDGASDPLEKQITETD